MPRNRIPSKSSAVKMIALSSLKQNERNPRKISDAAFDNLCKSIKRDPKFMELRPIIIDGKNIIVGGNQRFRACEKLGKKEVPETWVKRVTNLTEQERKRFILMDNAPDGVSGYWDYDLLQLDYKITELESIGFIFPEQVDVAEIWKGMPEFVQENTEEFKHIIVHFKKKRDYDKFMKLIGQKLTEKTRVIWYPKIYQNQMAHGEEYVEP